jgi:hypothetical protein
MMDRRAMLLLVPYVAGSVFLLVSYRGYLHKPNRQHWNQAQQFLREPGRYQGEPVRFQPSWLANYALDYSRFKDFNVAEPADGPAYWLMTTSQPRTQGYEVVEMKRFGRLRVVKLARTSADSDVSHGLFGQDKANRPD